MTSDLLLIAAAITLCLALRSYRHPAIHRLGTFGLLFGTSFLIGWRLLGSMVLGVGLAATWLLIPWIEILTRARKLRLPMERELRHRTAPAAENFPNLNDLTHDIESAGFEYVDDLGWEHDDHYQFYRLFYEPGSRTEATICLVEQGNIAFFYIAITSRAGSGETYLTWNYPFSYGLELDPSLHLHRAATGADFEAILNEHTSFLTREQIGADAIAPQVPEALGDLLESDMRRQIEHNLACGVLKRDGTNLIRYSARGLLFLWLQFLRDLVRFS